MGGKSALLGRVWIQLYGLTIVYKILIHAVLSFRKSLLFQGRKIRSRGDL